METLIKNINIINPYKEVEYNCSILIKDDIIAEISNSKIKTIRYLIIINDNPARSIAMKFFNIITFTNFVYNNFHY